MPLIFATPRKRCAANPAPDAPAEIGRGAQAVVHRRPGGLIAKTFRGSVKDDAVEREYAHGLRAYRDGVPTWRLVSVVRDGETRAVIGSFEKGQRLVRAIRRRPFQARTLMRRLGELHARIHAVPFHDAPGWYCPTPTGAVESLRLLLPDESLRRVERLLASPESGFCHGDLSMTNVLCDGGRLLALDWARSGFGPFAADVGRTAAFILSSTIGSSAPLAAAIAIRRRLAREYMASYCRATGRSLDEVRAWTSVFLSKKLAHDRSAAEIGALKTEILAFAGAPALAPSRYVPAVYVNVALRVGPIALALQSDLGQAILGGLA